MQCLYNSILLMFQSIYSCIAAEGFPEQLRKLEMLIDSNQSKDLGPHITELVTDGRAYMVSTYAQAVICDLQKVM